jgi:hypothetical protein
MGGAVKLADVDDLILTPALSMLPKEMGHPTARAMLLAIGLQESRFTHRRQIRGPARGFWQFEVAGVRGILTHTLTRRPINEVLHRLEYRNNEAVNVQPTLEHNDILAACFARLNLWWLPHALPGPDSIISAWDQYIEAWRPGKPHPQTWEPLYRRAWRYIETGEDDAG